jgi:hypothetical protein
MNRAAKKRQEEIAEAVAVSTQRQNAADRLVAVPDDALFVLDKAGKKKAAVKPPKPAPVVKGKAKASSPTTGSGGVKKPVAAPAVPVKVAAPEVYDLWGEEPSGSGKQPRRRHFALPPPPSVVLIPKVPLPAPGTSYNPSFEDHQVPPHLRVALALYPSCVGGGGG